MAKTRRRGGGIVLVPDAVKRFFGFKEKTPECVTAEKAAKDACSPAEATAPETKSVAQASSEMSGAPAAPSGAPASTGGRSRRRRQTRRKYKAGKHRKH